ncbi:MAG: hypothetical protein WCF95_03850 [bacterium]
MSFPFNGGQNSYQPKGAKDDIFIKPRIEFEFQVKKTEHDISLFDITNLDELNDTGRDLKSEDIFADVEAEFDGPKWLGLTGKGVFGDEPKLMETSFLKAPPKQTDKEGNPIKRDNNPGNDWNWNTLV